jgi:epimerase transport system membrane fusion protein
MNQIQTRKDMDATVVEHKQELMLASDDVLTSPVTERLAPIDGPPTDERSFRRLGMFVTFGMLGFFILWASFAPLKSAVVASGKIVVESRNKVVQHLDGGLVAEIFVKEGDLVQKGQPLLRLSEVQIQAQLDIVNSQLWEAMANLERLNAERDGRETLVFSALVMSLKDESKMAQNIATQTQLFNVRRLAFHSEQSVLTQRVAQTKSQIQGLERVKSSEESRATSLRADVKDWQSLFEQQFADKVRLREMQRQLTEIEGSIAGKSSDIARLNQVIAETERQKLLRQQEYLKEVTDSARDAQSRLSEAEAKQSALKDQLHRIDISAPDDGRVVGFNVVTVGAVIEPRRPIMEIVPAEHSFAALGQVQTMDVDMIMTGQRAEIKFTAFNTSYLPVLYGHVVNVAADATIDEASKMPYYAVKVVPEPEAVLLLEKQGWKLVSGMPADVYVQTRSRTLMSYFIKPLQVMFSRAFNEEDGL